MRGAVQLIIFVLTAMTALCPIAAETLDGYTTRDLIIERLSRLPLIDIEGIWLFPATGQTVVIERTDSDAMKFQIVAAQSAGLGLENGTLLGYISPTAKTGMFDASLVEINPDGSLRTNPYSKSRSSRFTLNLSGGRLSFTPVHRGIKANWWRLFPYMFRFSVRSYDDRAKGLDGCIRIWPRDTTNPPYQPRYL